MVRAWWAMVMAAGVLLVAAPAAASCDVDESAVTIVVTARADEAITPPAEADQTWSMTVLTVDDGPLRAGDEFLLRVVLDTDTAPGAGPAFDAGDVVAVVAIEQPAVWYADECAGSVAPTILPAETTEVPVTEVVDDRTGDDGDGVDVGGGIAQALIVVAVLALVFAYRRTTSITRSMDEDAPPKRSLFKVTRR